MTADKIAAAICLIGLALMFWFVPRAYAAERQGFQWALWMQLPNRPAEVVWLFQERTACELDLASSANAAPKGSRFKCERRK